MITVAQLNALGVSDEGAQWRVRRKRLHRVHRGVYSTVRELTHEGRWLAAQLAVDSSTLGHRSAGMLQGFLRRSVVDVHLTVPSKRKPRKGFVFHEQPLHDWEITIIDGILTTTWARTLMDLCAGKHRSRVELLVKRAHTLQIYDDPVIRRVLDAHPHAPGSKRLRGVIDDFVEPPDTDSEIERLLLQICAEHRFPTPLTQYLIGSDRVDFFFPAAGLVIEVDGRGTHGDDWHFEDDRRRDAELEALGYRVVRFTRLQLRRNPDWVARILRRLLGL